MRLSAVAVVILCSAQSHLRVVVAVVRGMGFRQGKTVVRVVAQHTTTHRLAQAQPIKVLVGQVVAVLPLVKVAAVQVSQAHQACRRLAVMVATA